MRSRIFLLLAILPVAALASVVVVYSLPGTDKPALADMREFAGLVASSAPEAAGVAETKGLGYKSSDGNVLTSDLAAPAGSYAYYWSDGTMKMTPGITPPRGAVFENVLMGSGKGAVKNFVKEPIVKGFSNTFAVGLNAASGLRVSYSLATPGPVTVELFGAGGHLVGRWKWHEAVAGLNARELSLAGPLPKGHVFVRYSTGRIRLVQKLGAFQP